MNALIVEDEELAVRKLQKLLHDVSPTLSVVGVTASIEDTVNWLESHRATGQPDPRPDFSRHRTGRWAEFRDFRTNAGT